MSEETTISIVTICYNNPEELQQTISSVDKQELKPHEHIIVDGSSTDTIRRYLNDVSQPAYRRWISEKDEGIADAFNKGVLMASGKILNMLNAGDTYFDKTVLQTVSTSFAGDENLRWLHGMVKLKRGGLWVTVGKPFDPSLLYRGMRSLSHQSMFVKRSLHDKYGLYDRQLKNAMDYDFVCRIANERFLFIPEPLVVFAPGGTTDVNYLQALREGRQVYEKHFGKGIKLSFWQARLKILHFLLKGPAGNFLYRLKVKLKLENA
jgi:glycosyltransferase involved in cell wall biosynthesis